MSIIENNKSLFELKKIIKCVIDEDNKMNNKDFNSSKADNTKKLQSKTWMNQYIDLIVTQFIHYKIK